MQGKSLDLETYKAWYQQSITDPTTFWGEKARQLLSWMQPFTSVLTGSFANTDTSWFNDGKLNASFNCLDRHLATRANQTAIIWEGDDPTQSKTISYAQLHASVSRFANVLLKLNVKPNDHVCIYMPMIPEAAIAMLACSRIGAVHSVVFGGFSAEALKTRILDANCKLVITANESIRNGKALPMKANVDEALKSCPTVEHVIVVPRTDNVVAWNKAIDIDYHQAMATASDVCEPISRDANDALFILYTSGSTGKPKGILHHTAGYLVYAAMTFQYVFDYRDKEIFWCSADIGWVTGHTYGIYGPLLQGATIVMFEGVPNYPYFSRFWQIIDKHQVNIFYTAPTAIRALRKEGDQWVQTTSRKSLRILGTVGEPINPEAWQWYFKVVGNSQCQVVDTWWQTETGGIMITPLPYLMQAKPGAASWPFFGVVPKIVDDHGNEMPAGKMGNLIITQPWPGMMTTIYGNPERFKQAYFATYPNCYLSGDEAYRDTDGYFWISGRSDDVIKVSGHRIGTGEIESALILHPAVSETAVVPIPDEVKGQAIYAFVTLRAGYSATDALKQELIQLVRKNIGAIATISTIQWADGLPKTRSGKIMRRILRKIATGDTHDLGDLSTLSDPSVVETLIGEKEKC